MTVETPAILVEDLWKSYPLLKPDGSRGRIPVLAGVTFRESKHEFLAVLGPNASGKTTLINLLAGLDTYDSGKVELDGQPVQGVHPPPSVVMQDFALFDWMTVRDNVEFGLKVRGLGREERRRRAEHYLGLVQLMGHEKKYPQELSGGLKQRTALARALALESDLLLLDEPTASLDSQVRRQLQALLLRAWEQRQVTILLVTHDVEEAILLSDRVIVFSEAPATVRLDLPIALPRPRDWEMRFERVFREYVNRLRGLKG